MTIKQQVEKIKKRVWQTQDATAKPTKGVKSVKENVALIEAMFKN